MATSAIVQPAITPGPHLLARQAHGAVIGYASQDNAWSPVYCKPGKRVYDFGNNHGFGCFTSDPSRTDKPAATTCWCPEKVSCWSVHLYTDISDQSPRLGLGCTSSAYTGNLYITTPTEEASSVAQKPTETISSSPPAAGSDGNNGLTNAQIAGIVVGAVSALAGVISAWIACRRKRLASSDI